MKNNLFSIKIQAMIAVVILPEFLLYRKVSEACLFNTIAFPFVQIINGQKMSLHITFLSKFRDNC